jgi:hypothetical protein
MSLFVYFEIFMALDLYIARFIAFSFAKAHLLKKDAE